MSPGVTLQESGLKYTVADAFRKRREEKALRKLFDRWKNITQFKQAESPRFTPNQRMNLEDFDKMGTMRAMKIDSAFEAYFGSLEVYAKVAVILLTD